MSSEQVRSYSRIDNKCWHTRFNYLSIIKNYELEENRERCETRLVAEKRPCYPRIGSLLAETYLSDAQTVLWQMSI